MNTKEQVLASLETSDKSGVIPAINELNRKMPKIITSTEEPTDADGQDGDIWIVYEEPAGGA